MKKIFKIHQMKIIGQTGRSIFGDLYNIFECPRCKRKEHSTGKENQCACEENEYWEKKRSKLK